MKERIYEAQQLRCTDEQFRKMAYPEPEPSRNFRTKLDPKAESLIRRLKRWNGDDRVRNL